jgi:hypothetical protein
MLPPPQQSFQLLVTLLMAILLISVLHCSLCNARTLDIPLPPFIYQSINTGFQSLESATTFFPATCNAFNSDLTYLRFTLQSL